MAIVENLGTVEVKELWSKIEYAIRETFDNPYDRSGMRGEKKVDFEVNGAKLEFFTGAKPFTSSLMINGDFHNILDLFNGQGGLKWAWRNLKQMGII